MSNKLRFFLLGIIGLAVAAVLAWFLHSSPSAKTSADNDRASNSPSPEASATAAPKPRAVEATARQLYLDENNPQGFSELAELAQRGDLSAKHFTLQLVSRCSAWESLAKEKMSAGAPKSDPKSVLQERAASTLNRRCEAVLTSPYFSSINALLKHNPVDVFDQDIPSVISQRFADSGAESALTAAVSAIKARPDETSITTVNDTINTLNVGPVLATDASDSSSSMNPARRKQMGEFALNLLACDYGRDCGPNSDVVLSLCAGIGVCIQGASLEQIYRDEMLSGEDMRSVLAILDALRKYQPWNEWTVSQ